MLKKFKEILLSVIPLIILVLILQLALYLKDRTSFNKVIFLRFLIGTIILTIGLFLLLQGLDMSIIKVGDKIGSTLIKKNKIPLLLLTTLFIGVLVSVAEPDLQILAKQISDFSNGSLNRWAIVLSISFGVGILMFVSVLRTLFNLKIKYLIIYLYSIIFIMTFLLFTLNESFIPIAFDSSASVTGAIVVPFILSYGIGITKRNKKSKKEDGFGMVAIAAAGTIIGALSYFLIKSGVKVENINIARNDLGSGIIMPYFLEAPKYIIETTISLVPFIILFIIFQIFSLKLKWYEVRKIINGFSITFFGLFLFLLSANVGFIEYARYIAENINKIGKPFVLILGLLVGLFAILSESSVHVLTGKITDVTKGSLKRIPVLIALSIGVGLSLLVALIKSLYLNISYFFIIIPLYGIALILISFTPNLFAGLAFDSGAVSSGPMGATFLLGFVQGTGGQGGLTSLESIFGTLGLVTVFPIITIELLGIIYNIKEKKQTLPS